MAKRKPSLLRRLFRSAVLATTLGVVAAPLSVELSVWRDDVNVEGGTPLTEGEKRLAESIFGDQINTEHVRKHFGEPHPKNYLATVEGGSRRHIHFWGAANHSNDYSRDSYRQQNLFMHEMTHIWQHQNHILIFNQYARGCKIYDYELTDTSEFDDFCVEQQAEIIGDYVVRTLHPHLRFWGDNAEYLANLQRVVEDKFPQARITRLELESAEIQENTISYPSLTPAA